MHKMIAAAIADVRTDFAPARDIHMPVLEQNRSGPGSVDFDLNSPWVAFEPPIHGMASIRCRYGPRPALVRNG